MRPIGPSGFAQTIRREAQSLIFRFSPTRFLSAARSVGLPRRGAACPRRARRESLALHQKRESIEPRAVLHLRVVEDDRARADGAISANAQTGGFQHPVLEQMGLQDCFVVNGSPVTHVDEIKLDEAGSVDVHAASDSRAEQPQVPYEERRASKRLERERCQEKL